MDAFFLKQHPRPFGVGLSDIIKKKLRTNVLEKTVFYDISRGSGLLPQLDSAVSVHPQLETLDFYKKFGGSRRDIEDYVPESSAMQHMQESERKDGKRKSTMLEEILQNFHIGQISFVGQAGSGKTTLLKAITREIIGGKHKNLRGIEVVHFVHLRSFRRNQMVTPAELLFRSVTPEMSDAEMKEAVTFAKENPDKVIFVLDSLDTIPYTIDGVYTSVSLDDRCSPEPILFHLLSGTLLPGCRFITSSREYAIRNYKGNVRAKQVIALAGLTKKSMKNIVVGYLGEEEAKQTMAYLETKPVIESLCATPVWLIFTLMALKTNSEFKPDTMAGILVVVLQSMIRSEHTHVKDIEVVVIKLVRMAFRGTAEHRVEFSNTELSRYGLEEGEIADLVVMTPSGRYQNIILGDTILIFAHQCLQEILSAFLVTRMKLTAFKSFIGEYIHTPHFAVVRRFLAGVLLNKDVFEASENLLEGDADIEEKKWFMKKSIEEALRAKLREKAPDCRKHSVPYADNKRDIFELYLTLSEAGETMKDAIQKNVHDISPWAEMISPSEGFSIGWVMTQTIILKRLQLARCSPTSAALSALYNTVKDSNIQLHELDVSENQDLGIAEMSVLGKIVTHCNVSIFRIKAIILQPQALQAFLDSSIGVKLHELDISDSKCADIHITPKLAKLIKQRNVDKLTIRSSRITVSGLESFLDNSAGIKLHELDVSKTVSENTLPLYAKIAGRCGVDILRIQACNLDKKKLISFLNSSVEMKLHELDLSGNHKLGPDEMQIVTKIIKQCKVKVLIVRNCRLSILALESFLESSDGIELEVLDFSVCGSLTNEHMELIANIATRCGTHTLKFERCELYETALESFLKSSVGLKLQELDFSASRNLGPRETFVIGKIVRQCKASTVNILGGQTNQLYEKALISLMDSAIGVKVASLDLRGNENVFKDGGKSFGRIVKRCGVEHAGILLWDILSLNEKAFRHALDDRKLCTVNMVDHDHIWELHEDQVKALCKLLPYVEKEIDLSGCGIAQDLEDKLQRELDARNTKDLKIIYGKYGPRKNLRCRTHNGNDPSISLNRVAEVTDSSIIVSWKRPKEGSNVQYRVEIFCDDQPIGEVHIFKETFYQTNVLPPSDICCFKISVVNPDGTVGCGMYTNEILTGNTISKPFEEEISIAGGTITVADCSVAFRPGTFTKNTKVSGKLEIRRWKWPPNYTSITPMLYIHPENDLLLPAVLEMKSWCSSSRSKGGATMVHILHYCEESKSWEVINELPLNNESILRFECQKFSPIEGALRDDHRGPERYNIESHIYMSRDMPEFSIASHLDTELLRSRIHREMTECDFRPRIHFNPIRVTLNDNIQVVLSCASPPGFSFDPRSLRFTIDQDFIYNGYSRTNTLLTKTTKVKIRERLKIQGHIEKDGDIVHGLQPFYYEWKETAHDRRRRPAAQNESSNDSPSEPRTKKTKTSATFMEITGNQATIHVYERVNVSARNEGSTIPSLGDVDQPSTPARQHDASQNVSTRALENVREELPLHRPTIPSLGHVDQPSNSARRHDASHNMSTRALENVQENLPLQPTVRKIHPRTVIGPESGTPEQDYQLPYGFRYQVHQGSTPHQLGYGTQYPGQSQHIVTRNIPEAIADIPRTHENVQRPPEVQGLQLVRTGNNIRVSWDEIHGGVTYCINIYCNDQLCNIAPIETSRAWIEFSELKPSFTYRCEVWAINYQGVESARKWSNSAETGSLGEVIGTSEYVQLPRAVQDLRLMLTGNNIRVSWSQINGDVTYCIKIYCNGEPCHIEPIKTANTLVEFSEIMPSCIYQCEVWTVNSQGVESARIWSNAVETPGAHHSTIL